jgi:S1-C subfamily serine protease
MGTRAIHQQMIRSTVALAVALLGQTAALAQESGADAGDGAPEVTPAVRDSVVKVFATYRAPSFERPWTKEAPEEFTGTGFVIDGQRIITNAHVVEQSSQVFVQPPNSSDRLRAEVVAISQEIDLAVLQIRSETERAAFFSKHAPLTLMDKLPPIGSTVQAIGFPIGGEQQSVTEGVVSRIEFTGYSSFTSALRIQVDAPINPGNSGGPVVLGDRVIGVTFSGIDGADNIGYVIPVEELRIFLADVADGTYDGKPRMLVEGFQTAENPALRERLTLTPEQTGLVYVGRKPRQGVPLEPWDVLDRVGTFDVDNDGLVTIEDGLRVQWGVLLQRAAKDGVIAASVIRAGQSVDVSIPVDNLRRGIIQPLGNAYPEYFVYGPLVFTKAYEDLGWWMVLNPDGPIARRGDDERTFDGEELVVVTSQLLPHPITKGYEIARTPILKSVNGTEIKNLAHLVETLRGIDAEFVEFRFFDREQEVLVFRHAELTDAAEEILDDNGIRSPVSPGLRELWPED